MKGISSNQIISALISMGALFLPFDNLALKIFSSSYDLSSFLILLAVFLNFIIFSKSVNYLFIFLFILAQLIIFSFNDAPLYRLISGTIWFGGILLIFTTTSGININIPRVYKCLQISISFSALYCLFELFIFDSDFRPKGWFSEPSPAGLVFYSASLALFYSAFIVKNSVSYIIYIQAITLLVIALFTKSMHLVTFILTFFLLFFSMPYPRSKAFKSLIFLGLLSSVIIVLVSIPHYSDRLNFNAPGDNLSILSWLRGYEQAFNSISSLSFFGNGLGSTGFIIFSSVYSDKLASMGFENLNLLDSYSMLFRLIIEVGLMPIAIFIYIIFSKIKSFTNYIKLSINISRSVIFCFIFSLTLLVGILIKEPVYSRSFVYVGSLLFMVALPKSYFIK